jgi:hypothetical protein
LEPDARAKSDAAAIDPMIAQGRQSHYPPLSERFAKALPAPQNPTLLEAMSHRLQTPAGQKLHALRKQTPEPVFGIIKSVMGFASSFCAASTMSKASGASSPWRGT